MLNTKTNVLLSLTEKSVWAVVNLPETGKLQDGHSLTNKPWRPFNVSVCVLCKLPHRVDTFPQCLLTQLSLSSATAAGVVFTATLQVMQTV